MIGNEPTILSDRLVETEGSTRRTSKWACEANGRLLSTAFSGVADEVGDWTPSNAVTCWTDYKANEVDGHANRTEPPAMVIHPELEYAATNAFTKGGIVVALDAEHAPIFISYLPVRPLPGRFTMELISTAFPRISIQGGDPTGTGTGNPGHLFP